METKKIVSAKEAAAAIEDGSTVVVCGCENILLPDYLLEQMTEKQAAELAAEFKCHLFDGLVIRLEDIFDRVL